MQVYLGLLCNCAIVSMHWRFSHTPKMWLGVYRRSEGELRYLERYSGFELTSWGIFLQWSFNVYLQYLIYSRELLQQDNEIACIAISTSTKFCAASKSNALATITQNCLSSDDQTVQWKDFVLCVWSKLLPQLNNDGSFWNDTYLTGQCFGPFVSKIIDKNSLSTPVLCQHGTRQQ